MAARRSAQRGGGATDVLSKINLPREVQLLIASAGIFMSFSFFAIKQEDVYKRAYGGEYFAGYPLAPPYTVLMVELTEGVRMLATLPTDIDPACLYCDQPMQFRAFELEPGASIPGFAPIS